MSAPIITRAIARRYLIATNQVGDELRVFDALLPATPHPSVPEYDDALSGFLDDFAIDRAELAMLAAAENLLELARFIRNNNPKAENTDPVMLIWTVVVGRGEDFLRLASVDPDAWERARAL